MVRSKLSGPCASGALQPKGPRHRTERYQRTHAISVFTSALFGGIEHEPPPRCLLRMRLSHRSGAAPEAAAHPTLTGVERMCAALRQVVALVGASA